MCVSALSPGAANGDGGPIITVKHRKTNGLKAQESADVSRSGPEPTRSSNITPLNHRSHCRPSNAARFTPRDASDPFVYRAEVQTTCASVIVLLVADLTAPLFVDPGNPKVRATKFSAAGDASGACTRSGVQRTPSPRGCRPATARTRPPACFPRRSHHIALLVASGCKYVTINHSLHREFIANTSPLLHHEQLAMRQQAQSLSMRYRVELKKAAPPRFLRDVTT